MSATAVVERRTGTSDSVEGNEAAGSEAGLRREPIMRLVEDYPVLDRTGSTDSQQDQGATVSSFGETRSVDSWEVPVPGPRKTRSQATFHAPGPAGLRRRPEGAETRGRVEGGWPSRWVLVTSRRPG